jgi:hypothetical protein
MRFYRLTTKEFQRELERAACDDRRWPQLCRHAWLIQHAHVKDGEVVLRIRCENETKPANDSIRR